MNNDRIEQCIWLLIRRAQTGDICAASFLADYARLKLIAGEPLGFQLAAYAPTDYVQMQRNEIIRDTCPCYGPDDGPDALEDV